MSRDHRRAVPLSSVDAAWLHMDDPTNLMMVTGLLLFDEPLEFARLKATLEQRLLRFERFRQRVVTPALGGPYWETDPNFDISAHVHRLGLPAPGDQLALRELVGDLMSTPLDFSKPPWHFHLIEGYGGGCAVLARLHHCIADGIALAQVLLSMADRQAEPPAPTAEPQQRRDRSPLAALLGPAAPAVDAALRLGGTLLHEGAELFSHPAHALDLARFGVDAAAALGKLLLIGPDPPTPLKGKLGVTKRCAWSEPIALPDVKAVGRITGTTVNDVLLAAVAGALRRYLQSHGATTAGLCIRAVVPVNLRPPDAPLELGNRFGLVFVDLPVGIADPFERLLALKEQMSAIKGSQEALVAFGLLNAIGMTPIGVEQQVLDLFGAKATAVMTNLPGPSERLYLAGKPLRHMMFWVPQSGRLGLGVSIMSYAGEVCLGIATDAGLAPDPEAIVAGFAAEFDELFDLVRLVDAGGKSDHQPASAAAALAVGARATQPNDAEAAEAIDDALKAP